MTQEPHKPSPAQDIAPHKHEPSKREKLITEYVDRLRKDLKDFNSTDQYDIITEIAGKVIVVKPAAGADHKRPPFA